MWYYAFITLLGVVSLYLMVHQWHLSYVCWFFSMLLLSLVLWFLRITPNKQHSSTLPIKQQISIEPLKAATCLGHKLFSDEHTRKVFTCSLIQYTHMCLIKETIRQCTDQEVKETVINLHEHIMKQAAITFHVRVNFYFDIPGFKEKISQSTCDELLLSVADSYMEFSSLPKQEYVDLFTKYIKQDFPHLKKINSDFIKYVKVNFESINAQY